MKRKDLEHIIRAAAAISGDDAIVVVGSQSILGTYPNPPPALVVSLEADVFPMTHVDRADLIDASIGEGSPFHDTFGYYAQGVGPETSVLPMGWRERLVTVENENTRGARGLCLDVHDLLVAKAIAGREKDLDYIETAVALPGVDPSLIELRLDTTEVDATRKDLAKHRLRRAAQLARER